MAIRFYTHRFHAKLFIFEEGALIGSSNMTDGGLASNREGTVLLDPQDDPERYGEVQALFSELWASGDVLTDVKLKAFTTVWNQINVGPDPQKLIDNQVGHREPPNISVDSTGSSKTRDFLEGLRRDVYERYRPAFLEVNEILVNMGLRRPDLAHVDPMHETNRFLNWVRLRHVHGDDAWRLAPIRDPDERRGLVSSYGAEWVQASDNMVPDVFFDWLDNVSRHFGTADAVDAASKAEIGEALMSLHAFTEQLRFVKGGMPNVLPEFWRENSDDTERVRSSVRHLLHGNGDFAERLHDVLFDPYAQNPDVRKVHGAGTVRHSPSECIPASQRSDGEGNAVSGIFGDVRMRIPDFPPKPIEPVVRLSQFRYGGYVLISRCSSGAGHQHTLDYDALIAQHGDAEVDYAFKVAMTCPECGSAGGGMTILVPSKAR